MGKNDPPPLAVQGLKKPGLNRVKELKGLIFVRIIFAILSPRENFENG